MDSISIITRTRDELACIAHNGSLYAIGGRDIANQATLTIEKLDLANMSNISADRNWYYAAHELPARLWNSRAIQFDDYI